MSAQSPSRQCLRYCRLEQSGQQLLPIDDLPAKWQAFGWETQVVDGHDEAALIAIIRGWEFGFDGIPKAIIARTVKGKGVPMLEGHGPGIIESQTTNWPSSKSAAMSVATTISPASP